MQSAVWARNGGVHRGSNLGIEWRLHVDSFWFPAHPWLQVSTSHFATTLSPLLLSFLEEAQVKVLFGDVIGVTSNTQHLGKINIQGGRKYHTALATAV